MPSRSSKFFVFDGEICEVVHETIKCPTPTSQAQMPEPDTNTLVAGVITSLQALAAETAETDCTGVLPRSPKTLGLPALKNEAEADFETGSAATSFVLKTPELGRSVSTLSVHSLGIDNDENRADCPAGVDEEREGLVMIKTGKECEPTVEHISQALHSTEPIGGIFCRGLHALSTNG